MIYSKVNGVWRQERFTENYANVNGIWRRPLSTSNSNNNSMYAKVEGTWRRSLPPYTNMASPIKSAYVWMYKYEEIGTHTISKGDNYVTLSVSNGNEVHYYLYFAVQTYDGYYWAIGSANADYERNIGDTVYEFSGCPVDVKYLSIFNEYGTDIKATVSYNVGGGSYWVAEWWRGFFGDHATNDEALSIPNVKICPSNKDNHFYIYSNQGVFGLKCTQSSVSMTMRVALTVNGTAVPVTFEYAQ